MCVQRLFLVSKKRGYKLGEVLNLLKQYKRLTSFDRVIVARSLYSGQYFRDSIVDNLAKDLQMEQRGYLLYRCGNSLKSKTCFWIVPRAICVDTPFVHQEMNLGLYIGKIWRYSIGRRIIHLIFNYRESSLIMKDLLKIRERERFKHHLVRSDSQILV